MRHERPQAKSSESVVFLEYSYQLRFIENHNKYEPTLFSSLTAKAIKILIMISDLDKKEKIMTFLVHYEWAY